MRRIVLIGCIAVALGGSCSDDNGELPRSDVVETTGADDTTSKADDGEDDVAVGTFPTRAPEVTGRLAIDGDTVFLAEPSDDYYAEMILVAGDRGDDVLVVDEGGNALSFSDLEDGMLVDVWVAGGCAESYPVQCDLEALRIDLGT